MFVRLSGAVYTGPLLWCLRFGLQVLMGWTGADMVLFANADVVIVSWCALII